MSSTPQALATLVQLEKRVRACTTVQELAYLIVNDTHSLAPYRQAALWRADTGEVQALSGLSVAERHAPFVVWLQEVMTGYARRPDTTPQLIDDTLLDDASRAMWQEHLPGAGLWLPLTDADGKVIAGLGLWREAPWHASEQTLLALLADAYAHAWRALVPPVRIWDKRSLLQANRKRLWMIAAGVLLLLLFPVRQSILVPAEVVAHQPAMVRAPVQGVVDKILVTPNQMVRKGDVLLTLDVREMDGQLESARQAMAVAAAELRQGQQQALFDERSKAVLNMLQGKYEQALADVQYMESVMERSQIQAVRDGIVIFDDPSDWVGRPVALGERIMLVADPADAQLEVQIPVADAIALPDKADVRLFLNVAPTSPLPAHLLRVGYRAGMMPDGVLAYRARAAFDAGQDMPRVGLRGTAKVYGKRTVLVFYLLRRPLAALRSFLGW